MSVYPAIHLLPTCEEIPRQGVPSEYLRRVLDHVALLPAVFESAVEKRQALYLSAVCDLAGTHTKTEGQALFESFQKEMDVGNPSSPVVAWEIRRLTLAIHGLARDRMERGAAARPFSIWLEAADQALQAYHPQSVAASRPPVSHYKKGGAAYAS